MAITDELRKNLTNTTPLYVAAGTADLALQKLRELPATVERLRTEAPERLPRLREQAQSLAFQGVGIALEYAVKARETYDGLAERGKTVVETLPQPLGGLGGAPTGEHDETEAKAKARAETEVRVERADTAGEKAPVTEPEPEPITEPKAEEPKPKATPRARKAAAPRKKAAPKDA
jgi:hypothetical protein